MTGQNEIDKIPRHPQDHSIAHGHNLNPSLIATLVRERILLGAIFRGHVSPEEIKAHTTPALSRGFREACEHFTRFFVSSEKGLKTTIDSGTAVIRGMGYGEGLTIDTPGEYTGRKRLIDFFPGQDEWLLRKITEWGKYTANGMGEYGYHIFHAPAGHTPEGYYAQWHTHNDFGAHMTFEGATLEMLPGDISIDDAQAHPEKYEDRIIRPEIGDVVLMGRVIHRSSHNIPEQGQFAAIAHGPWYGTD